MGREGAKGDKNGGINIDGIIEECVNYLLKEVNGLWGQQGGVVSVVGVLDFGAIGGGFQAWGEFYGRGGLWCWNLYSASLR